MPNRRSVADHIPIDSKNAGLRNEKLVLSLLKKYGELSQAQLCELAGLSSSTASYIVGRLREKGLILEKRGQSVKRGARPVLVSIHPRGQLVVGVEISPSNIFMGLFDFNGELVGSLQAPVGYDRSPRHVVELLEINLRGLLGKHGTAEDKLVGIGVTLSGSISSDGVVKLSSPLGWKDVPLKEMLETRFEVPLDVYTTRVRLLAEISIAPHLSSKNILLLNFSNGVGASLVVDGHLVHGATNRAGEVGHIVFDPDGPPCGCGHKGCLEALVSGPALAARIRTDLERGTETILRSQIKSSHTAEEIVNHLGKAIEQGDQYALEVRDLLADYVSRAAAIAINCYDPEVLVLAGYVTAQCSDFLIQAITKRIASDVYDSHSRSITIIPARAGEQALIRGVATAMLNSSMEFH
jgi:N-acetylglucosamine repressor